MLEKAKHTCCGGRNQFKLQRANFLLLGGFLGLGYSSQSKEDHGFASFGDTGGKGTSLSWCPDGKPAGVHAFPSDALVHGPVQKYHFHFIAIKGVRGPPDLLFL